jgi:uncharacterized protein (TIGR00251 family)
MIKVHPEGCVLSVRAQPGARRIGIQGVFRDSLKIAVSAPPEDGRANAAICEVIQKALGLKRSQIELISGQTSREKRILIRGISVADLELLLAPCLD